MTRQIQPRPSGLSQQEPSQRGLLLADACLQRSIPFVGSLRNEFCKSSPGSLTVVVLKGSTRSAKSLHTITVRFLLSRDQWHSPLPHTHEDNAQLHPYLAAKRLKPDRQTDGEPGEGRQPGGLFGKHGSLVKKP
jgi:hypothetical protein